MLRVQYFLILIAFVGWAILCNWWYLCKIKNVCNGDSQAESSIGILQATPTAPAPVETALLENEEDPIMAKVEPPSKKLTGSSEDEPTEEDPNYPSAFTIRFQFDSDQIRDARELGDWLSEIRTQPGEVQHINIIGHTCTPGSPAYNKELGLKRALAVKQLMIDQGFPGDKIEVESRGKEIPLDANATDEDREQNRRAEIVIK